MGGAAREACHSRAVRSYEPVAANTSGAVRADPGDDVASSRLLPGRRWGRHGDRSHPRGVVGERRGAPEPAGARGVERPHARLAVHARGGEPIYERRLLAPVHPSRLAGVPGAGPSSAGHGLDAGAVRVYRRDPTAPGPVRRRHSPRRGRAPDGRSNGSGVTDGISFGSLAFWFLVFGFG